MAALAKYGGSHLATEFRRAFAVNRICVAIYSDTGALAAVCWAERASSFAPWMTAPCILIARCFTLPEYRGRGLYPAALKAADRLIPQTMQRLDWLLIECSMFNYSSKSGILKAGFRPCGMAIDIGKKRIGWKKDS
jgi:GNAT superfamily N-acetyltransferase